MLQHLRSTQTWGEHGNPAARQEEANLPHNLGAGSKQRTARGAERTPANCLRRQRAARISTPGPAAPPPGAQRSPRLLLRSLRRCRWLRRATRRAGTAGPLRAAAPMALPPQRPHRTARPSARSRCPPPPPRHAAGLPAPSGRRRRAAAAPGAVRGSAGLRAAVDTRGGARGKREEGAGGGGRRENPALPRRDEGAISCGVRGAHPRVPIPSEVPRPVLCHQRNTPLRRPFRAGASPRCPPAS